MRSCPVLLALSGLLSLATITVHAQCAADQVQDQWNGGTSERNLPGYSEWQSFTAGAGGALCQVDLMFCNSNNILFGSGTLNIFKGEGLGGALLATQPVMVNGTAYTTNQPFWQSWTVNAPPFIDADSLYTFQFIPIVGGGLPDPYLIQIHLPSIYPGGHNGNLGVQGDCTFRTYVNPSGVGLPAEVNDPFAILVFPDPVEDQLILELAEARVAEVLVLDMAGALVQRFRITDARTTFNVSGLKAGLYVVHVVSEDSAASARFVKY